MEEDNKVKSKYLGRYIVCVIFILLISVGFIARLVDWQIINGVIYRDKADSTNTYNVKITPARGEILDVNGVDLAINITGYNVVFNKVYFKDGTENDVILTLIKLFDSKGQKWIDKLPIVVDENGDYVFLPDRENEIATLKKDYRLNNYASAQDCINMMASDKWFKCAVEDANDKRNILSVRYNMNKTGYNREKNYTFAESVDNEIIAIIAENSQKLQGVQPKTSPIRKYVNGTFAPHIVGSIGSISQEEYDEYKNSGLYSLDSKIGKSGIERALEKSLIGKDGMQVIETTADGETVSVKETKDAVSGNTVYLTLDARLQRIARNVLSENIPKAASQVKASVSAGVAMLNVKDFSVLCAQSYPSFDLTRYYEDNDYYNELIEDSSNPLYSRVFEGAYTIGSTMKPAVALGALEEGVTTDSTVFRCNHVYQRFAPSYRPVCMGTHGSISLQRAMAVSCNIFFYETGFQLGIDSMNLYQSRLGLGQKTGVEIYERSGILAGPKERQEAGGTWYDGDTIAAAIGQSDNLITPIQLATYAATIANNGTRLRTHLISKITDYSRQTVITDNTDMNNIEVMDNLGVSEESLKTVQQAMRAVVSRSDGTAYYTFGAYEIPIAAKTGTAENADNSPDHSTLIAYAPYEDPQVAIGIIVEHGKIGTWPAAIAKALFDGYFKDVGMEDVPATNPDGSVEQGVGS